MLRVRLVRIFRLLANAVSLLVFGKERQMDGEAAALAGRTGDAEVAVVAFDNFLCDVEAQPDTTAGASLYVNFGNAVEALENMGEFFRGDADTLIGDGNDCLLILTLQFDDDWRARRRVFARIGEQIENDLANAFAVDCADQFYLRDSNLQCRTHSLAVFGQQFPQKGCKVAWLAMQGKHASFDRRSTEQIVHQTFHATY